MHQHRIQTSSSYIDTSTLANKPAEREARRLARPIYSVTLLVISHVCDPKLVIYQDFRLEQIHSCPQGHRILIRMDLGFKGVHVLITGQNLRESMMRPF